MVITFSFNSSSRSASRIFLDFREEREPLLVTIWIMTDPESSVTSCITDLGILSAPHNILALRSHPASVRLF